MKKKNTILNVLNWFKDAGLKALVILLVVATGFYAYAQITWPGSDPNPTTGVVGMFVGESEAAFSPGMDYSLVNDECANHSTDVDIQGSHICTPDEMVNSYNHGTNASDINVYFPNGGSTTLWINSGPPGYTANSNDCKGWTATDSPGSNPNYGTIWNFDKKYGGLLPCKIGKKFACCK